jgi:tetratricopeptide (TPR) repeat protein
MDNLVRAKELFLRGLAHQQRGEPVEAEACYRQALDLAPERPSVLNNLAAVLLTLRRFPEAEVLCRKLVAANPRDATALLNLGNCQLASEHPEDALASFDAALAARPDYVEALVSRATALVRLDRLEDALATSDAALAIDPGRVEALINRGVCLRRLQRFQDALASYGRALAIDPRSVDALAGKALALLYLNRSEEALASCELALAIRPDHLEALDNRAVALANLQRLDDALASYGAALTAKPGDPDALNNRALLLLLAGRLEEGWREYRHRWARPDLGVAAGLPTSAGTTVAIHGEQGLGDQLFFLRWLPQVRQRALKPRLALDPRLTRLLARSPDVSSEELQAAGDGTPAIATGDLPHLLWGSEPYPGTIRLAPSPESLRAMRVRLGELGPPPYVGVAWRAGTPLEAQGAVMKVLAKAVALDVLARMLAGVRATVVSVQRRPGGGETEELARLAGVRVHDLSAANADLEEALALMALLDEYVGVSSTNVHLRHAAGRPSRVLVPNPPEWRWGVQGESRWFPGTAVYREQVARGWDEAVARIRRDLALPV